MEVLLLDKDKNGKKYTSNGKDDDEDDHEDDDHHHDDHGELRTLMTLGHISTYYDLCTFEI